MKKTTLKKETAPDGRMTELVFILDQSGSMEGLEKDTIGGFNATLKKQQALPDSCRLTTILFNSDCRLAADRLDIQAVSPMTEKDYRPGGSTALIDAIGLGIAKIDGVQKAAATAYKAGNVMFVIITDGMENSSHRYTANQVKKMIEQHKEKEGWEFIFLGANIDAVETAGQFGISPDYAQNYVGDSVGTVTNFEAISDVVSSMRQTGGPVKSGWKKQIDAYYKKKQR